MGEGKGVGRNAGKGWLARETGTLLGRGGRLKRLYKRRLG